MPNGQWHSFYKSQPTSTEPHDPSAIPLRQFDEYCDVADQIRATLDDLAESHRTLTLSYEEKIAPLGTDAFLRVYEFLGVPLIRPTWLSSSKVAPGVDQFVSNARELYERFGSRYGNDGLRHTGA